MKYTKTNHRGFTFLLEQLEPFIYNIFFILLNMYHIQNKNPNPSPMKEKFGLDFCGDPSGSRTPDTLIKSQVLCQLS